MEVIPGVEFFRKGVIRVVQEDVQIPSGEVVVAVAGDMCFEDGHTVEIA